MVQYMDVHSQYPHLGKGKRRKKHDYLRQVKDQEWLCNCVGCTYLNEKSKEPFMYTYTIKKIVVILACRPMYGISFKRPSKTFVQAKKDFLKPSQHTLKRMTFDTFT